ncbi:HsdM family class I SAM-dependent methyltransferase [Faecalicatena contorta]|uniref:site-specific DNA-methyltransferase (adenine-specific) n=1 Tax=Faecalicatena contorta TaxID=39482 RepID=A0A315ZUK2_9FIRM|nr:N-6 DNA methylase [Faecalicatena contorta]PWJ48893.1 N-6 DNA methylase [Faecalicatena contorta]SUQ14983.1 N-6 DNA Methylase [Faecalicatena contorta]
MAEGMRDTYPQSVNWNEYKDTVEKMKKKFVFADESKAISFARTFCYRVVRYVWRNVDYRKKWDCRQLKFDEIELDFSSLCLAKEIAEYFTSLNIMEYAYLMGNLYTMLLPDSYRSDNGIYYTPPSLAERLLDILAAEGADWAKAEILDPACGGGAFLVTVASRVLGDYRIREMSAEEKLFHLDNHLAGVEFDKFAALLTQCLLDIIVYPESVIAGRRLKPLIKIRDTVRYALKEKRQFDVIVGNPPYGKVKLDNNIREKYARSLYGHANLYGLFIDASVRLMKPDGLLGFVTPTSFLGGKYFSNLRNFLSETVPPLDIDFLSMRNGVFDQVLQETCLVVFGSNPTQMMTASKINVETDLYNVDRIGSFKIEKGAGPWIIAREAAEAKIISGVKDIGTTIEDYGYKVSTGQLVWNRLKDQIFEKKKAGVKPIIWAEAITTAGKFDFNYTYRKEKKYVKITDKQKFLVCNKSAVLVQRTTAKEQKRRLQTCVLPQGFIDKWGGVVVENHVNIIHPMSEGPKVSLEAISLLLNSTSVDRIFRCLSGSVAVSASELHALPLPPVENLDELEEYVFHIRHNQFDVGTLEQIILRAYEIEE